MNSVLNSLAAFLSSVAGSLGLGGGGVLILYLTLYLNMNQRTAQGINLLFFIPCAALSVVINCKKHILNFKTLIPFISGGILGAFGGVFLADMFKPGILKKIFAVFLIIVGIKELIAKKQKN